jgi:hypothetical protein
MEVIEALRAVLDAAKRPKQFPPGVTPTELSGDAFLQAKALKAKAWHESLTLVQEMACRRVWETCGRHYEPWERFEFAFLCEYNIDHELAVWIRIAIVFQDFVKRHPSVKKRHVIGSLCGLSAGDPVTVLKERRARELTELWNDPTKA